MGSLSFAQAPLFKETMRFIKIVIPSLAILTLALYFFLKPGPSVSFSPEMLSSTLQPDPRWSIADPSPEEKKNLQAILSQKFTFIGEGNQAIAFQSADEKYILKLFKMRRLIPSLKDRLRSFILSPSLRKFQELNEKLPTSLLRVLDGYKNGYQDLRSETGLIWIHLAKTTSLDQTIELIDSSGNEHRIHADSMEFVIQEKAEPIIHHLSRLYKEGKTSEAQQAINSFYALIQHRTDCGYVDRDKAVLYNYGFVGDRPIQIDLGRLYKSVNKREHRKKIPLERAQQRIERWKLENGITD
jgi:hypothetical protein